MKERAFALLTQWCDGLLRRQILHIPDAGLYGAVLCPACSSVHGRIFDAVYPLLYLAKRSGEKRYADAAAALLAWSEHVSCPDGGWVNDTQNRWKGTTTFAAIALSEAFARYGDMLPEELLQQSEKRLERAYAFLHNDFDPFGANINYLAATAYALQLGALRTGRQEYAEKAAFLVERLLEHCSENGLIFGEGHPWDARTPKGCLPIDLGYNAEETLNLLALYAHHSGNRGLLTRLVPLAAAHLLFFLPDGGIDNSFGSRNDKWTYWGSRTADGCFPFLLLLREFHPDFEYAAAQNLELLRQCTRDGLLMGGRDLANAGEPACVHHSFTHAKALAFLCEFYETHEPLPLSGHLPCQSLEGFRFYPELDTYLYHRGNWRATFTGYDSCKKPCGHVTGGAVSLLYHARAGILLVAGMVRYGRFEPNNTQRHREDRDDCLALRYELPPQEDCYSNVLDAAALLHSGEDSLCASAHVVNYKNEPPPGGAVSVETAYRMQGEAFTFHGRHGSTTPLCFYLPLVAKPQECMEQISNREYVVTRQNGLRLRVTASCAFDTPVRRIFHHVPGFCARGFAISNAPQDLTVTIRVE